MGRRAVVSIAAGVAVGLACIVGYLYAPATGAIPQQAVEAPKPQEAAPAPAPTPQPRPEDIAAAPPAGPMSVPTFDVVVVDPSGEGVLAGRAEAKWKVEVESGSTKIAETTADEQGEWSIVLDKKLPPGDHQLSLRTVSPDGSRALTSQQSVQVAVGKAKDTVASLTKPEAQVSPAPPVENEPGTVSAPSPAITAQLPSPFAPQTQASTTETTPKPVPQTVAGGAPTVTDVPGPNPDAAAPVEVPAAAVAAPQQQSPVIAKPNSPPAQAPQFAEAVPQAQSSIPPEPTPGADEPLRASPPPQVPAGSTPTPPPSPAKAAIVFKTVDYQDLGEDTGKMKLAGTSEPGATIQLYFDDKPLAKVTADRVGQWSAEADMKLGEGQHSFRAERVDETGRASSDRATVSIERRPQAVAKAEFAQPPSVGAPPEPVPAEVRPGETGTRATPSQQTAGVERAPAAGLRPTVRQKKGRPNVYTVRRGDTLWDLAERYLGGGWRYTSIFRGNRKVIRDPDEILPRQRVTLPSR